MVSADALAGALAAACEAGDVRALDLAFALRRLGEFRVRAAELMGEAGAGGEARACLRAAMELGDAPLIRALSAAGGAGSRGVDGGAGDGVLRLMRAAVGDE